MSNRLRVNRRSHIPPQEYIVIVGGPSDTYNGWCNDIDEQTGQEPPADASGKEIDKYCQITPQVRTASGHTISIGQISCMRVSS